MSTHANNPAATVLGNRNLMQLVISFQDDEHIQLGKFRDFPEWSTADVASPRCISPTNSDLGAFLVLFPPWFARYGGGGLLRLMLRYPNKRLYFVCGLVALEDKNALFSIGGRVLLSNAPKDAVLTLVRHIIQMGDMSSLLGVKMLGDATFPRDVTNVAAAFGDVEMLEWLFRTAPSSFRRVTMDEAAKHGRLYNVIWLHEHTDFGCTANAMDSAAQSGHLNVCKWLRSHRTEGCSPHAFQTSSEEVLRWLLEHYPTCWNSIATQYAAKEGNLLCLQILHNHFPNQDMVPVFHAAVKKAQIAVLRYLVSVLPANTTNEAISSYRPQSRILQVMRRVPRQLA